MAELASRYDVVIVGAGLAGCALALALARADLGRRRSVLLIDLHRDVSPRFSGEFIHPRGAAALDELGCLAALRAAGGVDVEGFAVMESAETTSDPVVLDYAAIEGERPHGISVHHKTLVRTMRGLVRGRAAQVELREGWRLTALRRARGRVLGVTVRDPDGSEHEISCDLVVGADGKGSTTRKLAGIPDRRERLGYTVGLELRDAQLDKPLHANVLLGGPGPMLCYPIATQGEHMRYRLTFDLPQALPVKGAALAEFLLDAFVPYLPGPLAEQVAQALRDRARLEMAPTFNLPAPPATAPGLALVGDAAGCSHPITASGMTMGLLDAMSLGHEARRRRDPARMKVWIDDGALRRYRLAHDRYVPTRQALADAIFEAFRGEDEGARGIRRALFGYWRSGERQRVRSLALLACAERRPHVFLAEYLKTAQHVLHSSLTPRYAPHYPLEDRLRQVQGAVGLAGTKIGVVAQVAWAQMRPF